MDASYDVAIIGGGPAGSTAATLLAQAGRRVVVCERAKFPRFAIGESLLPYSMKTFERLGVRDRLDRACQRKIGAEIATSCGKNTRFYFTKGFRLRHQTSYQVLRSEFDQILLERAREAGAEVREETPVAGLEFDAEGVTLDLKTEQIRARYVLDGSGRGSVLGQKLGLREVYPNLKKFSVYAHYEGVEPDGETEGRVTRLLRARDRWYWLIAVSPTRTSVGVVMDSATFKAAKLSPEEMLETSLRDVPIMRERVRGATRITPVYSVGDYSYRCRAMTGERWMMAGDAAGFIDPIFSTGVFIAVFSGEDAADALNLVLDRPAERARVFARYEKKLNRVMDVYLRYVEGWYRHEFIEVFSAPQERFQLPAAVNSLLAGNIDRDFGLWWRLQLFNFVIWCQRKFPLVPRLSFVPHEPASS